MNLRTIVRMLPDGADQAARGCTQWAKTLQPPNLRVPNQAARGETRPAVLRGLRRMDGHPTADLGGHRLAA